MKINHLEIYSLAERLHRQFLDVIQLEIDRLGYSDLNSVRAMIVYNVGDAEMTVSELMWRGCYLGSNVSYNLKKLTEAGYITQTRSTHDKRVFMIRNSARGAEVCHQLQQLNNRHQLVLGGHDIHQENVVACAKTLGGLQKYWSRALEPARSNFGSAIAA
jgi:DNA-binding MarR family transcriptional regulator